MKTRLNRHRRRGYLFLLLAAGFLMAGPLAGIFSHPRFGVQPLNLHPALALAAATLHLRFFVPLMALLAPLTWFLEHPGPIPLAWLPWWGMAAVGNALAYTLAAVVLRRLSRWGRRPPLHPGVSGGLRLYLRDLHVLLGVSFATASWCALTDAVRLIGQDAALWSSVSDLGWRSFVANLLGMVVWVPVVLYGRAAWDQVARRCRTLAVVFRDFLVFATILVAVLALVFGLPDLDHQRMAYLVFLPVVAVAMRHGLAGAILATPFAQVGLLTALVMAGNRPLIAFEFQMLILTMAVCALYLGALTDQRHRDAFLLADHQRRLRERREALDEVQRIAATAELAAAVAHDLSQPVSAIGTFARAGEQILLKRQIDSPELADVLQQIRDESARAGRFLHRMRDFFRQGTFTVIDIEVRELVRDLTSYWESRLAAEGVGFQCHVDAGVFPVVRGDPVQIAAILGNLMTNARDAVRAVAAGSDGRIEVWFERCGNDPTRRLCITVTDTGQGVAPAMTDKLFQPLRTTKVHGMGLGLALSRSMAQRMGGQLWCETLSSPTRFCLSLPFSVDHADDQTNQLGGAANP